MKKTVFITGTSSGFGREIAKHLHEKGHVVIGTSRNPKANNYTTETLQLDVNDMNSINVAMNYLAKKYPKIDVLINNAGFGIAGAVELTSIEEAKGQIETNFFGVVRMIQAFIPYFRKRDKGLIINVSSIGGLVGLPFQAFYSASKFALEGFTQGLRSELRPFNIQVTHINPGDFATDFGQNRQFIKNTANELYEPTFSAVLKIYKEDEIKGANPQEVAFLVEKLIHKKGKLKIHYLIGPKLQVFGVFVKRMIGATNFEYMMRMIYKIK